MTDNAKAPSTGLRTELARIVNDLRRELDQASDAFRSITRADPKTPPSADLRIQLYKFTWPNAGLKSRYADVLLLSAHEEDRVNGQALLHTHFAAPYEFLVDSLAQLWDTDAKSVHALIDQEPTAPAARLYAAVVEATLECFPHAIPACPAVTEGVLSGPLKLGTGDWGPLLDLVQGEDERAAAICAARTTAALLRELFTTPLPRRT